MSSSSPLRLAMIGFGPRGLGALEALAESQGANDGPIDICIFDPMPQKGAGPNFTPDQTDLCVLNVPTRGVDYEPPQFMAAEIARFEDWAADAYHRDEFPSRADVGAYLCTRYETLMRAKPDTLSISESSQKVTQLVQDGDQWWAVTEDGRHGPFDEVLLTPGQPKTAPDPQLSRWEDHAAKHELPLRFAYPADPLIRTAQGWKDKTVAIRGMGLSTLDVLRMLTEGQGGKFVDGVYHPSGKEPRKLLPFSLDGKPPVAKPATADLDARFDLTQAEIDDFVDAMVQAQRCDGDEALRIICDALVAPITRILEQTGGQDTEADVRTWLTTERNDTGSQDTLGPIDGLRLGIDMAFGNTPPDAGYVTGQVWRKLQDQIRAGFNQGQHDDAAATAIIGFDEGLKRYSYGPPVSAAKNLLSLIEHGIVSLCIADDPSITLGPKGWHLVEDDDAMTAGVMVDAVIPSPNIEKVVAPLITALRSDGFMHARFEDMGAHTLADGQLVGASGSAVSGLSLLGRLAFGSVIAVDSLTDCFGASATRWAEGLRSRQV